MSKRTLWVRPTKLLWVAVITAALGAMWLYGTPHMLWNYRYTGSYENKYYTSCDYIGRDSQTVWPRLGECPFVMLLKPARASHG